MPTTLAPAPPAVPKLTGPRPPTAVDASIAGDLAKLAADPAPAGEDLSGYKPVPGASPEAPKPPTTSQEPTGATPTPPEPKSPPQTPPEPPARKESVNAELRHKAEAAEKRIAELEESGRITAKQAEEFRAKLEAVEPQAKMADTLKQQLEEATKVAQEREERLKRVDYTQSQEFHENFVKPVAKALESAYSDVSEMVVDADGTPRQATKDDFKAILSMPLTQATAAAKSMFGDLATEVLAHRRSVLQAQRAQQEAVAEAGKRATEFAQRQIESAKATQARVQKLYQESLSAAEKQFPDLFTVDEKDKEAWDALQDGRKRADLAIFPTQGTPPEQVVPIVADVRQKAAAFPLMLIQNKRLQQRNAELEKKLAAYEASAPKGGTTGASGVPDGKPNTSTNPWERTNAALAALANQPG